MQYTTTPGARGICPSGWHIPTLADFQTLAATVGNDGNALKAGGQGVGSGGGNNTSGFSALLAGARNNSGVFNSLSHATWFWSSTRAYNWASALGMGLYDYDDLVGFFEAGAVIGFSVRCLKD